MIKYYSSRELSEKFNINLAKWKRWAREFLPPDPLGGLQSGYSRQFTVDDAFLVFLGGHLVGSLQISIPDTKRIIKDLSNWMEVNGFFHNVDFAVGNDKNSRLSVQEHIIGIYKDPLKNKFKYRIQDVVFRGPDEYIGAKVTTEKYVEAWIPFQEDGEAENALSHLRTLYVTRVLKEFVSLLRITPKLFPVLSKPV